MKKLTDEEKALADQFAIEACRSVGISRERARQLLSEHIERASFSFGVRSSNPRSPHPILPIERELLRSLQHSGRTMTESLLMLV